jgi:hypothetical protein
VAESPVAEPDLDALSEGLDEAVSQGHLPNPGAQPLADDSHRNAIDSRAYIWALRTRLIALGYLGEKANRDSDQIDPRFVKAVRRFQGDIGDESILQDGWAGPKTWQVMQSLVSFEDAQEPRHWQLDTDFGTSAAVARAAYLRLWVMGFFDDWKRHKLRRGIDLTLQNPAFRSAYARFWRFAQVLDLDGATGTLPASLDQASLSVLFNHDNIIAKLASDKFAELAQYQLQLDAIARIELWLHGYDSQPGPPRTRTRRRGPASKRVRRRVVSHRLAIAAFWKDNDPAAAHSPAVDRALFVEFTQDLDAAPADQQQFDRVIATIDAFDDTQAHAFEEKLSGLASAIWDGLKRLAKSIWRFFRGVVRDVASMMNNLARLVAREARRYFHLVVRAVDVVQGGIDYLRHSVFPEQEPCPLVIGRGDDFDHYLLLAPGQARAKEVLFARYRLRGAQFNAGCVIVGELLLVLREIAAVATNTLAGPIFWLKSLLALGKVRRFRDEVAAALKMLEAYEVTASYQGALIRFDVA